jgi:DNA-binding ferritin-like protein (Dps family)
VNFWEKITGADMKRDWRGFEARAAALPEDYRQAWEQIKTCLWEHGDFTGRNLTPVADGVIGLLEATAANGLSVADALGDDLPGFCAAVAGEDGAKGYRDKWREQLNRNVARRISKLGE